MLTSRCSNIDGGEGFLTLFSKSMSPGSSLSDSDSVDIVLDARDVDDAMSMCAIRKSDEDFDYFVGFEPVLEVVHFP